MAKPPLDLFQIALIGGESLLGGELKDVFEAQLKTAFVSGYAASGEGSFGESEGEAVYLDPFDDKAVAASSAVVSAGASAGALKAYSLVKAKSGKLPLIDCTGALEQEPEALIVAPIPGEPNPGQGWLFVTAQPAAAAISQSLARLARWRPVARCVANVFEPASELGKAGAGELHQQTSSLLAFRALDKNVFDAQAAFNMLAAYGPNASRKLETVERRIEKHLAVLLGKTAPMPSLRLIQVPVFHAYSLSLWVEFETAIGDARAVAQALASAQIEVREPGQEPNGVAAAGQSGFLAGDIRVDRNNPRAVWIWLVCDNLRVTADIAVTLLRSIQSKKP